MRLIYFYYSLDAPISLKIGICLIWSFAVLLKIESLSMLLFNILTAYGFKSGCNWNKGVGWIFIPEDALNASLEDDVFIIILNYLQKFISNFIYDNSIYN